MAARARSSDLTLPGSCIGAPDMGAMSARSTSFGVWAIAGVVAPPRPARLLQGVPGEPESHTCAEMQMD
eukprot:3621841-Lingulodinium_polyedra.AAC.1